MKLSDVQAGDELLGYYLLTTCELRPYTGGVRLQLRFQDASGKLDGVLWGEEAEKQYEVLKKAKVVKVKGLIDSYRGNPQLKIVQIRPVEEQDKNNWNMAELIEASQTDPALLEEGIQELIETISDQELKSLIESVFANEKVHEKYFQAPGGTRWHHPYLGGLAEHSLSMAQAVDKICEHYTHLDRSLLISGALVHDIGKIMEMEFDAGFHYSVDGRLYGHIVMGYELVKEHALKLEILHDTNVKKLLHMILAHQGKKEYSTPVIPTFEEAFVLYFIDEIDSKLNAIARIREKPENKDQLTTKRINLLDTPLYLGIKQQVDDDDE